MKKIGVLSICLLVASNLWAQKDPVALKKAAEAGKAARAGQAAAKVPQVEQAVKAAINNAVREPAGLVAYFHRLGDEEEFLPQVHITPVDESIRSLSSLREEARALGMTAQNVETWPREDLEEFITTVKVFSNVAKYEKEPGGESLTRDDAQLLFFLKTNNSLKLSQWTARQPDYYPDNYLPLNYKEKFHPDVKFLRVLLVSNDSDIISRVRAAQRTRENVQVDIETHIDSAIKQLENMETRYDIIVTDFGLPGGLRGRGGYEMGMYVWNKKLHIPVVLLSKAEDGENLLMLYNIIGQSFYLESINDAHRFFNYLSNIVATGKAYPHSKQGLAYWQDKVAQMDRLIEQETDETILLGHYPQRAHLKEILGDEAGARADRDKAEELYNSMD